MAKKYDVIVVGAGHAGIEAAFAAARLGARTLLVTMDLDTLGQMSCNPAIGGIGKGQLVKEIDALGGIMGRAADACGIQFRRLNASKGPAVRSSRAQMDMFRYKMFMKTFVEHEPCLELFQAEVTDLVTDGACVAGVRTSLGEELAASAVVLCPGTFLDGVIHIGLVRFEGGRIGESSSKSLARRLKEMGFATARFKTGTCPRLDARSLCLKGLTRQDGDHPPEPFSFSTTHLPLAQVPCHVTYTNASTHEIIRNGLDRSPLYTGRIHATGVRYCPSIEDKIVRFADRERHQIFLEPEGLDTVEVYPNGLSTSLPRDVQERMVRSIPGLEDARIVRPGYGIEYDHVDPTQLAATLETRAFRNLYLAGQINGTTGYEEAAAQGLIAGANAGLRALKRAPFTLGRDTSYIGVLIDDLVTRGTNEPYRMFTSRVEYRLVLREDNADLRLCESACRAGLLREEALKEVTRLCEGVAEGLSLLKGIRLSPERVNGKLRELGTPEIGQAAACEDLLKRPQVRWSDLEALVPGERSRVLKRPRVAAQVEIGIKYAGYIARENEEILRFQKSERMRIPEGFDFRGVRGLSTEIVEKLTRVRPGSVGQAARVPGVTPAAVALIMVMIEKERRHKETHG